jgi:hypothetical protein
MRANSTLFSLILIVLALLSVFYLVMTSARVPGKPIDKADLERMHSMLVWVRGASGTLIILLVASYFLFQLVRQEAVNWTVGVLALLGGSLLLELHWSVTMTLSLASPTLIGAQLWLDYKVRTTSTATAPAAAPPGS